MTRRWTAGFMCILVLGMAGCAGSSKYMVKADAPTAAPLPDKSVVYFLRPSGIGFAINFQIWDRERFIGLSQAKSYFAYLCDPGKHLFIGIAENKVAVEAELAPGKRYYVITEPRAGGWKARLTMTPVVPGAQPWAETLMKDLEYVVPVPDEIQAWETERKEQVRALVDFFERDPEREKYLGHLVPTDGR